MIPFSEGLISHIACTQKLLGVHHGFHHPMQDLHPFRQRRRILPESDTTRRRFSIPLPSHKLYPCLWESGVYSPQ